DDSTTSSNRSREPSLMGTSRPPICHATADPSRESSTSENPLSVDIRNWSPSARTCDSVSGSPTATVAQVRLASSRRFNREFINESLLYSLHRQYVSGGAGAKVALFPVGFPAV